VALDGEELSCPPNADDVELPLEEAPVTVTVAVWLLVDVKVVDWVTVCVTVELLLPQLDCPPSLGVEQVTVCVTVVFWPVVTVLVGPETVLVTVVEPHWLSPSELQEELTVVVFVTVTVSVSVEELTTVVVEFWPDIVVVGPVTVVVGPETVVLGPETVVVGPETVIVEVWDCVTVVVGPFRVIVVLCPGSVLVTVLVRVIVVGTVEMLVAVVVTVEVTVEGLLDDELVMVVQLPPTEVLPFQEPEFHELPQLPDQRNAWSDVGVPACQLPSAPLAGTTARL
jgi:hypothetical protein